jgi:hypothetical protein
MAGFAWNFEANSSQVNQVLGVRTPTAGDSRMPLRTDWDRHPLATWV